MLITFFSTDLEREFAKYAVCKAFFFVFGKSQILTRDNFTIYRMHILAIVFFAFLLKLRFAKCKLHFFNIDLPRVFAKYAICRKSYFVFAKSQISTSAIFAIFNNCKF